MKPRLHLIKNSLFFLPSLIGLFMLWMAAELEQDNQRYAAQCIGCSDYMSPSAILTGIGFLAITFFMQAITSSIAINSGTLPIKWKKYHRLWLLLYPCLLLVGLYLIYR